MPRNEKNPATSVMVVWMIEDAVAGSWPNRVRKIGTSAPAMPASSKIMTSSRRRLPLRRRKASKIRHSVPAIIKVKTEKPR